MKLMTPLAITAACWLTVAVAASEIAVITENVETGFATYVPRSEEFAPSVAPYTVEEDLSNVLFADRYTLSTDVRDKLVRNGFAAVPTKTNKIHEVYTSTREAGLPVFVTTDAMLHTFHILYDYTLRIAEHERFYFQLGSMLEAMLNEMPALLAYSGDDSLETAITRTAAFLEVAHVVLTDRRVITSPVIDGMVSAELALIEAHEGFDTSRVVRDLFEDFSQYVPRGHYTRNERFEKFFKSMMYLGRIGFRLGSEEEPGSSRMETMQACILARLLATASANGVPVADLWEEIYQPTVFFVGRSDDLNFKEYREVLDDLLDEDWVFGDIGVVRTELDAILTQLRKLRPPLILSGFCLDTDDPQVVTKSFRVMGQRFVPDSYMLGKLVYTNVGTQMKPRLMPYGLDVLAVLGSQRAYNHLIDLYEQDQYDGYVDTLAALREAFAAKPAAQWAENLYWNWMYVLVPLLDEVGLGYPMFMTTEAWADKTLTTASGSWAELRHDTILYAKQSYTSYTTSVPPPPTHIGMTQGYVEPNPEVFARLAALARYMKMGFGASNLSDLLPLGKLDTFADLCVSLRDIAIKELEGGSITCDEYKVTIGRIGGTLEALESFEDYSFSDEEPDPGVIESDADSTMAVIADVHTDPNTQRVLEVGVGKAMDVYVAAPIEGRIVLCRGSMFSYYEFPHPMADRLTDEKWQGMLADGSAPDMPVWTASFAHDSTKGQVLQNYDLVDEIDVVVSSTYEAGEQVEIGIVCETVPDVTVTAGNGSATPVAVESLASTHRAAIPAALTSAENSLLVEVNAGTVSYRKLLVVNDASALLPGSPAVGAPGQIQCRGSVLRLPDSRGWSLFDAAGRELAAVPIGIDRIDLGQVISSKVVLAVGNNGNGRAVYRIVRTR